MHKKEYLKIHEPFKILKRYRKIEKHSNFKWLLRSFLQGIC